MPKQYSWIRVQRSHHPICQALNRALARRPAYAVVGCELLEYRRLLTNVTVPVSGIGSLSRTDGGTYAAASTAQVGLWDRVAPADNTTHRAWVRYAMPNLQQQVAVDRLMFNCSGTGDDPDSKANFKGLAVYGLWSEPNDMSQVTNWYSKSSSTQYGLLSGAGQTKLVTSSNAAGGSTALPPMQAVQLVYYNQGGTIQLALRESPESTDSTLSDDTSRMTYTTSFGGNTGLTLTYAGKPTNLKTDKAVYYEGDTINYSWLADVSASATPSLNFRLQGSKDPSFPDTATTEFSILDSQQLVSHVGEGKTGVYYWRVQVRNKDADTDGRYGNAWAISAWSATQSFEIKQKVTLVSVTIKGPTEVSRSSTTAYTATANYSDGTSANVTDSATWSDNSEYASITKGVLKTDGVRYNQTCTLTASFSGMSDTHDVTIKGLQITGVTISGPTSVNENTQNSYSLKATYDDGSTSVVTSSASWSENSPFASIDSNGTLNTSAVTSDQTCTITASFEGKSDTHPVTIRNVDSVVTGVAISGPSSVSESSTARYSLTATYDNGSTTDVTGSAKWEEDSLYASIDSTGTLTTSDVSSDQSCKITASFGGKSAQSAVTIKNALTPAPTAPQNLSAQTASQTQINLNWSDKSNNEDGFRIERASGGDPFAQIAMVSAGTTSYSDTGLQPDTTYTYRVCAYNSGGDSDYSNADSATTSSSHPTKPGSPQNLSVQAVSQSQIDLHWTDASNNELGFRIERARGSESWVEIETVGEDITSYSDGGLQSGTTYTYRVRAYNSAGNSSYSNAPSAKTSSTPPPSNPEIAVRGNGLNILDGDATPSFDDHTAFGTVEQYGEAIERIFTIYNAGNASLDISVPTVPDGFVITDGPGRPVLPGTSSTFYVRLNTGTTGTFSGDIVISSDDPDESEFNFRITGTVVGAPSETPFARVISQTLIVEGTSAADKIAVEADGDFVNATRKGETLSFPASSIQRVEVYAYGGNDQVTIGTGLPATYVLGDAGNDTIFGGSGNDTITGAAGRDFITGGEGDDRLNGGKHSDRIDGGNGQDRIYGNEDADVLVGNGGTDRFWGGSGKDTIFGKAGNDKFYVRDGEVDEITGDQGTDTAECDSFDKLKDSIENLLP